MHLQWVGYPRAIVMVFRSRPVRRSEPHLDSRRYLGDLAVGERFLAALPDFLDDFLTLITVGNQSHAS